MSDTSVKIQVNECIAALYDVKNMILYIQKYLKSANEHLKSLKMYYINNGQLLIDEPSYKKYFNLMFDIYEECYGIGMSPRDVHSLMVSMSFMSEGRFPNRLFEKCKQYIKTIENEILPKLIEHYNKLLEYVKSDECKTFRDDVHFLFDELYHYNCQELLIFYEDYFKTTWTKHLNLVYYQFRNEQIKPVGQKHLYKLKYLRKITAEYYLVKFCKCYEKLLDFDNIIIRNHILAPWRHKFMLTIDKSIYDSNMSIEDIIDKKFINYDNEFYITISDVKSPCDG